MKKFMLITFGVLFITKSFAFLHEAPKEKNFWEQTHVQADRTGGFYIHKPGTGMWQDKHVTPDNHGGFYIHEPGTGMWQDKHVTSDGNGGWYF